MVLKKNSFFL